MLKTLIPIIFGRSTIPAAPNIRSGGTEELFSAGLTMGTLIIGKQGSGKTTSLARHLIEKFKSTREAIFVLDWSGAITDALLRLILAEPHSVSASLLDRVIYDELGNPDIVVPLPEFSLLYGSAEEQVQRVANNYSKLAPAVVANAPVLGGIAITETAPQIFRLLSVVPDTGIPDDAGTWQISEAKRLLLDEALLRQVSARYGRLVPEAKWYAEKELLNKDASRSERELRTYVLRALLGVVEPRDVRARLGYPTPGWTPREAIERGCLVIINGSRLINRRPTQHYLFTQVYSLIMAEINRRTPGNPEDLPVNLVKDEILSLLQIPGMAEEVGTLAPLYRSRKLQLYVVIQALWQLADNLKEQIWSLGNVISFSVFNFDEAYTIAQQLFRYEPKSLKLPARSDTGQPIAEPDRGQYLTAANWLQHLKERECVVRRYYSERQEDPFVRHVARTQDVPPEALTANVEGLKKELLRLRGVNVDAALKHINARKLASSQGGEKPPTI